MIGEAVAEVVTEGWKAINADIVAGILIGILGAIGLADCIVSWWRERLAAILLVLTAVGFGIHIGNMFMSYEDNTSNKGDSSLTKMAYYYTIIVK